MAIRFRKPEVRIEGFGDSSVNYELLVWINIGQIAEKKIRSELYFMIFEALGDAGMEIPFPQREIRLRSES